MYKTRRYLIQKLYQPCFSTTILVAVLVVISSLSSAAEPRQIKRSPQLKTRSIQPRLILRPMRTDVAAVKALAKRRIILPRTLTNKNRHALHAIVRDIKHKRDSSAKRRWYSLAQDLAKSGKQHNTNAMIRWVIRESYPETTDKLQYYAANLRFLLDLKKELRSEIAGIRDSYNNVNSWPLRVNKIVGWPRTYRLGTAARFSRTTTMMTREQLAAYIQDLGTMLSTLGDQAQLTQQKLNQLTQQLNAAIAMLSAMMRNMHDTLKSIISNMRA